MTEGSAERMWKESLPSLRDTLGMVDDEFGDLTIDLVFGGLYAREDQLDLKTRELCIISMLTALHRPEEIKTHLTAAHNLGWTYEELRELMIISVLTGGWPAAADALRQLVVWRLERNLPLGDPGSRREGYQEIDWSALGHENGRNIFGPAAWADLTGSLNALATDLKDWAVAHLYGRLLTRGLLDNRTLMLCLTAAFAAVRTGPMLDLHIKGALNSGARPEEITELLFQCGLYAGMGAVADASTVWQKVSR